jgi:hypothetical protein
LEYGAPPALSCYLMPARPARQGKARQGKARQGKARQGKARQGNWGGPQGSPLSVTGGCQRAVCGRRLVARHREQLPHEPLLRQSSTTARYASRPIFGHRDFAWCGAQNRYAGRPLAAFLVVKERRPERADALDELSCRSVSPVSHPLRSCQMESPARWPGSIGWRCSAMTGR